MQRLWEYESQVYWKKKIYRISNMYKEENGNISILVYADNDQKAREISAERFNNQRILDRNRFECRNISPANCELLYKKRTCFSDKIMIIFFGKKILLQYNAPKSFEELGF
tara:strand:- start:54 stop:386 length:333 start_codon:yes stop_codon:yes gene_type:complete